MCGGYQVSFGCTDQVSSQPKAEPRTEKASLAHSPQRVDNSSRQERKQRGSYSNREGRSEARPKGRSESRSQAGSKARENGKENGNNGLQAKSRPARLDGACARGVRSRCGRIRGRSRARSARGPAPLPLARRWIDGDGSASVMEGNEEGWAKALSRAWRAARHAGDAGVDRKARRS